MLESKKILRATLEIRRKQLGPNHPDIAISLNNLGALYEKKGELKKAKEFYEQALEIRRNQFGPNRPDIAKTLNNLGALYHKSGEW